MASAPSRCSASLWPSKTGCMSRRVPDMAVLPLVPSDEEALLRESVAGLCSRFGPAYMRACNAAGEPPRELWDTLAERGYLGVNLPEEYGGGGLAVSGLAGGAPGGSPAGGS